MSRKIDVVQQRAMIRGLISPLDPTDAILAYYALYHDPQRTQLFLHHSPSGIVDGFVAVCQTGSDLFRPVVVGRAAEQTVLESLLVDALVPGRPYTIVGVVGMMEVIDRVLTLEQVEVFRLYQLAPEEFSEEFNPNVLIEPRDGLYGLPNFVISIGGMVVGRSGVNWATDQMAEIYVWVAEIYRQRGWGKALGRAILYAVLESGRLPIYLAEEFNTASTALARSLGFKDSGVQYVVASGYRRARNRTRG